MDFENDYGLDQQSRADLQRRSIIGEKAIVLCPDGNDYETAGKDVVSDILTALFGRAGQYRLVAGNDDSEREDNEKAQERARLFMEDALRSWEGDAEDYTYVVEDEDAILKTEIAMGQLLDLDDDGPTTFSVQQENPPDGPWYVWNDGTGTQISHGFATQDGAESELRRTRQEG